MPTRPLVTSYKDDLKIFPDMWHKVAIILGIAFVLWLPFYVDPEGMWMRIANKTLIATVGAVSLMVLTGFCGQISLGHAGFIAIGAFTMGLMGQRYELPFWLLMPLAGVIAATVGVAIGFFALRLKGLHLAIVTVGLLYLVRHVLVLPSMANGLSTGQKVPIFLFPGESVKSAAEIKVPMDYGPITLFFEQKMYFIFLVITLAVCYWAKNLARSNSGRAMMAVRDHDLAAATLGVNLTRAKLHAFAISSFLAGIAGAMYGMLYGKISVDSFHLDMSVHYIAMIVIGGIGTVMGAVLGAIAITVLSPFMRYIGPKLPYISNIKSLALQESLLFSILVIGFLVIEPLGLFGIWLRIKRYFMAWPFKY